MPAVGSSSSSSFGCTPMAIAISSHCFWPCASCPASLAASAVRSTSVSSRSDFAGQFRPREPVLQRDDQVLAHRQLGEDTGHLHLDAHAPADARGGVQLRDVLAAEADGAGGRRIAAQDEPEEGALARAVRPDQAVQLAFLHRERQVVDRLEAAEALAQVRASSRAVIRRPVARRALSCAERSARRRRQLKMASRFSTTQTI